MIRVEKIQGDLFVIQPQVAGAFLPASRLHYEGLPATIAVALSILAFSELGEKRDGIGARVGEQCWELDDACLLGFDHGDW